MMDTHKHYVNPTHWEVEANGMSSWEVRDDKEVRGGDGRSPNPDIGYHPTDFTDTAQKAIDKEAGEVLYASDNWVYGCDSRPSRVNWEMVPRLTPEQKRVRDFWDYRAFTVHEMMEVRRGNDLLITNEG